MNNLAARTLVALTTLALAAVSADAQCAVQWQTFAGPTGLSGYPYRLDCQCVVGWDPDGPGPLGEQIVAGGSNGPMVFDPANGTWTLVGAASIGTPLDLVVLPNGNLVTSLRFAAPGQSTFLQWNGTSWSPMPGRTQAGKMVALANGHLVAGGPDLARWDGSVWTPMVAPTGCSNVNPVGLTQNGDLVVIGRDSSLQRYCLAVWNGSSWSIWWTPTNTPSQSIVSAAVLPNGDILAAGNFQTIGGAPIPYLARLSGGTWSPFGAPFVGLAAQNVFVDNSGAVIVHGTFTSIGGVACADCARWDGVSWAPMPSPGRAVRELAVLTSGDLVAVGTDQSGGVLGAARRFDGTRWSVLGTGFDGEVLGGALDRNGHVVVVGEFRQAVDVPANHVASWDGTNWSALGSGTNGDRTTVVLAHSSGDLVIGGDFTEAGGIAANGLARWDGAAWHALGNATIGRPTAILEMPNGDLVVSDHDGVRRWNGATWTDLGPAVGNSNGRGIVRLAAMPNGDIVAGGDLAPPFFAVARWDGTIWTAMNGPFFSTVEDLAVDHRGRLFAAAPFLREWDGTSWSGLGPSASALFVLPNDDLLLDGNKRWDGLAQTTIPAAVPGKPLALRPNGQLLLAPSSGSYLGVLTTTCAPLADPIATTCIGPVGPIRLAADTPPWIGSTFQSTATGFAPGSLSIAIAGVAPRNLSLALVHPSALPNCLQLSSSEVLQFSVAENGKATFSFELVNTTVIAGFEVWHQFVQLELDPNGLPNSLSSSNALHLRIGAF